MLSTQGLGRGLVSRLLPGAQPDSKDADIAVRQASYGEVYEQAHVRKAHVLADEGAYWVGTTTSAIAVQQSTGPNATTPLFVLYNGQNSPRLYFDYFVLTYVAAETAGSGVVAVTTRVFTDITNRYSSGGTNLTANITNPNMDIRTSSGPPGVAAYFGAITATANQNVKTIASLRVLRKAISGTVANSAGDMYVYTFGAVDGVPSTVPASGAVLVQTPCPPIILGPDQSLLLAVGYDSAVAPANGTAIPEFGFWTR